MLSTLELKIPPVIVLILMAIVMKFFPIALGYIGTDFIFINHVAVAVVIAANLVGIAGVISVKTAGTTVDPRNPEKSTALVTSGIFRWTRNPMYLAMALLLLAFAIYLQTLTAYVWVLVFVLYLNEFQIKPEEKALRQLFGPEYRQYCQQVRRWL